MNDMRKNRFRTIQCLLAAVSLWMGANGFAALPSQDLSSASLRVVRMRCEHQDRPIGIDHPAPRLSWTLESAVRGQKQTAYRILAADSEDALQADRGTLWDSGKVVSARNIDNEYAGKRLISGQRVHWKVMVWDRDGHATDWSTPSNWEMGLLQDSDWKGQWICDGRPLPEQEADFYQDDPAPLFRRGFNLTGSVQRARLYISGLGYYQVALNGKTVGDHCLDPLWTRPDKRVFYDTHDVTSQLAEGDNCLGVTLGNGWYNPLPLRMWGRVNLREHLPIGRPRFIAQLNIEYADGSHTSVISDTSWKWAPGRMA